MQAPTAPASPRRILLATDLTSRGDRALDRAVQLARLWHSELHIVHVVDAAKSGPPVGVNADRYQARHPTPTQDALRIFERDIAAAELGATVHIEEGGAPGPVIVAVAERERCDLVVLGEPAPRLIGPLIENVTEHVMRLSPASVLAVRDRPRAPYRELLVGTDFTDEALQALEVAARLFPEAEIALIHAYTMPYAHLLEGSPASEEGGAALLARLRALVHDADLADARKAMIQCQVDVGAAAAVLRRRAIEQRSDLVVIGAHPRGVVFDTVVGNSRRIVEAMPADLLMVRAVRSAA